MNNFNYQNSFRDCQGIARIPPSPLHVTDAKIAAQGKKCGYKTMEYMLFATIIKEKAVFFRLDNLTDL